MVPLVVPEVVRFPSQSLPAVVAPEVVLEVVPLVVPDVVLLLSQSLPVVVAPEVVPLVVPEVDLLLSLFPPVVTPDVVSVGVPAGAVLVLSLSLPAVVAPDVVLTPLVVPDVVLTESASLPDVVLLVVPDVVPLVVRLLVFESLWSLLSLLFLLLSFSCISPLVVFPEVVLEVVPLVEPDVVLPLVVVLELWAKAPFTVPNPKKVNAAIATPRATVLSLKNPVSLFLIVLMVIIIKVKKYKL